MDTLNTALSLIVHDIENEPRILDTDLAKALGMERATNIRTRIKGMWTDMEALGRVALVECNVPMPNGASKTATAFHLNEEQATILTMAIQTPKAREGMRFGVDAIRRQ